MKVQKCILKYRSNGLRKTRTVNRNDFRRYDDFMRHIDRLVKEILTETDAEEITTIFEPQGRAVVRQRATEQTRRERPVKGRMLLPDNSDVPRLPRAEKGTRRR